MREEKSKPVLMRKNPVKLDNTLQDQSMDPMEETRVKMKYENIIVSLLDELHFSYVELERLALIYHKLCKDNRSKDMSSFQLREIFYKTFDMTDDSFMSRILYKLKKGAGNSMQINFETFAGAFSLFTRGTLDEKINFCFGVYDIQDNGLLGKDTIMSLLKNSMKSHTSDEDADEAVRDLIDILTKKMDLDRDGKISFADYKATVLACPLLLEAFGQCLPDSRAICQFLTTFTIHPGFFDIYH